MWVEAKPTPKNNRSTIKKNRKKYFHNLNSTEHLVHLPHFTFHKSLKKRKKTLSPFVGLSVTTTSNHELNFEIFSKKYTYKKTKIQQHQWKFCRGNHKNKTLNFPTIEKFSCFRKCNIYVYEAAADLLSFSNLILMWNNNRAVENSSS